MGTYLSTPVTDKCSEHGESLDPTRTNVVCRWGVVDQQGWRKTMEDAHIAVTDLPLPQYQQRRRQRQRDGDGDADGGDGSDGNTGGDDPAADQEPVDAKVFGVFDGHGGAEVARFCQLYLVSVLTQQPTWTGTGTVTGTGESTGRYTLPTSPDDSTIPADPEDLDSAGKTPVGLALRSAFHALDRMIDDPERRHEIMQLRSVKPQLGERRDATHIPPEKDISSIVPPPFYLVRPKQVDKQSTVPDSAPTSSEDVQAQTEVEGATGDSATDSIITETTETVPSPTTTSGDCGGGSSSSSDKTTTANSDQNKDNDNSLQDATQPTLEKDEDNSKTGDGDDDDDGTDEEESEMNDDDSEQAVGLDEAAEQDRDMMLDSSSDGEDDDGNIGIVETGNSPEAVTSSNGGTTKAEKLNTMFQKILAMGTTRGQVVVADEINSDSATNKNSSKSEQDASSLIPPNADMTGGPDARVPTVTLSGRMICNLPDHPVHAGATAIVAVLTGRVLTVANAGDSRAVMCRAGGETFALSFDHKPSQEREMTRIKHAGGFVNHFGRINGNLNLSRSIGDLKYKQVPGIPPSDQMITAEPDIKQVALKPDDEFIILGCDGIWDCLTNEAAVDFVRQRIDSMLPTEIGTEMLDQIISEDPRVTQGIGGDNQTVMIIDLQPQSRSCHSKTSSSTTTEAAEVTRGHQSNL